MLPFVLVPLAALAALFVALPALTVRSLVRRARAMAGTAGRRASAGSRSARRLGS
jgi:hypothetical protein